MKLQDLHCEPLDGAPMNALQIEAHLKLVSGWAVNDGAVERTFSFADYQRTLDFINAVAQIAHREDHHPDIAFGYNRATVRFNTHSVGGISLNDFICAAKVNLLAHAT
jgi:4a-hydroxytetrahydrobiopterin dehydratase